MILFSASSGGFYTPDINGTNYPSDAIEISVQLHDALLAGQAQGKQIVPGPDGMPMLVGPTLAQTQALKLGAMYAAYQSAIAQNVPLTTAAGVSKAFQADPQSIANVQAMLAAYKTAVPTGFYWVSADNTQVPFTLADLQGLARVMGDQGWAAFQQLQQRKASIGAATTVAAVQAVTW